MSKDSRLEKAGVSGYNKPKRTPNHPTKSHVVVAKSGDQVKTIRFGQQGVTEQERILPLLRTKLVRKATMLDTMPKILALISYLLGIGHTKLSGKYLTNHSFYGII
jgi:hypothetical protein